MYLEYYGWTGTQDDIAKVVKPLDADRNVNPDELAYYVRNFAGWLSAEFRVGGDLTLLKRLLAGGFPVIKKLPSRVQSRSVSSSSQSRISLSYSLARLPLPLLKSAISR